MKKFLLSINGPMCAGKSTITEIFLKKENVFKGSSDRIKWLISNYSADNEEHRIIAKKITFAAIESAVDSGLSVVIDGGHNKYKDKYKMLASQYGYAYLSVNIEAPIEILKQRFLERVAAAKRSDMKTISVTTLDGFQSRYNWYYDHNKDSEAVTFDSSKVTAEEIALEIEKLIGAQ